MKKQILRLIVIFSPVILFGCKDPLDGISVSINLDEVFSTYVSVNFNDADEVSAPPNTIELELVGKSKDAFIEISGVEEFDVTKGNLNLAVKPDFDYSESDPIKVTIIGRAEGYVDAITDLVITKKGAYQIPMPMVRISNPPEGVAIRELETTTDASGSAIEDIDVLLPAENGMTKAMRIFIPAGTKFLDIDNVPLVGNLSVIIAGYDPGHQKYYPKAPGKATGGDMTNEDGKQATSVPKGMVKVVIKGETGRRAYNFLDGIMTVTMQIPTGTVNPKTSDEYVEGDSVGVESMATNSSKWKSEKKGSVKKKDLGGGGDLGSEFESAHLSFFQTYFTQIEDCPNPRSVTVNLTDDRATLGNIYTLDLEYVLTLSFSSADLTAEIQVGKGFMRIPWNLETQEFDPTVITFDSYPNIDLVPAFNGTFNLQLLHDGVELTSYSLASGCSENEELVLSLPDGFFSNKHIVTLDVFGGCPGQEGLVFRPTLTMMYKRPGEARLEYLGSLVQGRATVTKLELGETYVLAGAIRGVSQEQTITIEGNKLDFEVEMSGMEDICESLGR